MCHCYILATSKYLVSKYYTFAVTWQLGLVEREINDLVREATAKQAVKPSANARAIAASCSQTDTNEDRPNEELPIGTVPQRPIGEDDVCPICQDELLAKHQPVTYCRLVK